MKAKILSSNSKTHCLHVSYKLYFCIVLNLNFKLFGHFCTATSNFACLKEQFHGYACVQPELGHSVPLFS